MMEIRDELLAALRRARDNLLLAAKTRALTDIELDALRCYEEELEYLDAIDRAATETYNEAAKRLTTLEVGKNLYTDLRRGFPAETDGEHGKDN